ncbi:exodeoxyribonuclease VII large subunit [[Phormidium ambiguum] IAM M-71]|uniref:Exodeoxyribonuclease 7 large subunit n=1 Tax=[Phormidium ambiguum] IAM M-71 TaxID=454136 RepID=A0A1U7IMB2_9CYAN|nr:exodeoxyribonuclease VII large subunit [Phormidium ambiguum]OKH38426.1 exodeoxyribonuclease VII large subunit [Phormidium ambiguum IAM M-71]
MSSYPSHNLILETALSVDGITDYIKELLEEDTNLTQVWIYGEVSSASPHSKGLFFTLQGSDGTASIRCVVWGNMVKDLVQMPKKGEQLLVLGSLTLFRQRGEYQLKVFQALPAGEGLQALRYQQLRNRLQAEGLFDPEKKRSLPSHPQTIAVVTSPQAAAWGDIQKTLKQRYPGLQVLLSPAIVQGEQAPDSIVAAIARVEKDNQAEVLILARGGGAVEDLACFNDERVVRAIALSSIPIVTGIGHQRDESLADLAADFAAHTPTAAAEKVVPRLDDLIIEHQERVLHLRKVINRQFEREESRVLLLKNRLRRLRIDRFVEEKGRSLSWLQQRLIQATNQQFEGANQRCQLLQQKLATLDPKSVLQRGYAVVRNQAGGIIKSDENLQVGEELLIQLGKGKVKVEVREVLEDLKPQSRRGRRGSQRLK